MLQPLIDGVASKSLFLVLFFIFYFFTIFILYYKSTFRFVTDPAVAMRHILVNKKVIQKK